MAFWVSEKLCLSAAILFFFLQSENPYIVFSSVVTTILSLKQFLLQVQYSTFSLNYV